MTGIFSLRVKFTIALLTTSLLSLVVAGLVARSILFRQFNQVVMEESFRRFQAVVAASGVLHAHVLTKIHPLLPELLSIVFCTQEEATELFEP